MAKSLREVPLEHMPSGWCGTRVIGRNLLARPEPDSKNVNFLRISPATSRKPIERWNIPQFPFKALDYTTYPPENILAAVGKEEG